jgi:hypothetical protein
MKVWRKMKKYHSRALDLLRAAEEKRSESRGRENGRENVFEFTPQRVI